MAEYISKDKLKKKKVYHFQTKGGAFPKSEPFVKLDDISNIPPADVVARSEYECLKKENRELAIKYDNAMNMVINEQENVAKLRSKIDSAIAEIEKQKKITFECDEESDLGVAIRIIKKHLGEVEE